MPPRPPIFQDEKTQAFFELNGYAVVPFLSVEEVAELENTFHAKFQNVPEGFYSTSFSKDEAAKVDSGEITERIVGKKAKAFFHSYKNLGSCFLSKSPGTKGEMPIHQDWTVVDETRFDSLTIWIPMCDVNETNGAMQVLEGSHRFSSALRSPLLNNPFSEVENRIRQDLKSVNMKAGEALIFSQALLHCSPPNNSLSSRLVVTYGFTATDAQLYFYYKNEIGEIEQHEVPDNFFQLYNTNIGSRPTVGKLLKTFPYQEKPVTADEYSKMKHTFLKNKQAMIKMKPLFKDESKQAFFEKEGYAVFPLLNETEVADLKSYYEALHIKDENGFGFHVSMDQKDKDMCRETREKVWSVALPKLDEHLKDYKPFVASYVIKEPNPKGVVPAHQDWSFVDKEEEGYCSVTCWVALVDMNLENGQMGVIKGSHHLMQNHRPSPSPQAPVPLSEHMFSIFPYLTTLDMKAGEVLMFDNRTIHASPPNTGNFARVAVGIGVTQKDAQLIHYYLKPDGTHSTIIKYAVDPDFFLKYENASLAKLYDAGGVIEGYEKLGEIPYTFTKHTSAELVELIKADGNSFNVPMCEKLSVLYGYDMTGTKQPEPPKVEVKIEESFTETVVEEKKSFFEIYTPYNILREVVYRITGR